MNMPCELPLATQSIGTGDDLVLLHGWGMNNAVWGDEFILALAESFRVHRIELPGHGESVWGEERDLDGVVSRLMSHLYQHGITSAHVCGWSLGGMVAQALWQRAPDLFKSLTLIASPARFAQAQDWQQGMPATVLDGFASSLQRDYRTTLQRFLALQTLQSEHAGHSLRVLRESVFARGEPDVRGLAAGLAILRDFDVRAELCGITAPVQLLGGERDRLVTTAVLKETQALLPHASLHVYPGAGHAPFISFPHDVVERIKVFCHA